MADSIDTSKGINVGDAVLRFLGDTTDLERAWAQLGENTSESATKAVNRITKLYDDLNIKGSLALKQTAEQAQASFQKLSASGVASMSDLLQAERRVIETQIELRRSLGEAIPVAVTDRLATLRLEYVKLTGTTEQYAAAQRKFVTSEQEAAMAAKNTIVALEAEAAAKTRSQAASERAAYNKLGITSVDSLKQSAAELELAYEELATGGKAAMSELVLAERRVLEAQLELRKAMSEGIPVEMLDQIALLRQEYARLTGTQEEYEAAQQRYMTSTQKEIQTIREETLALEQNAAARAAQSEAATGQAYRDLGITSLAEMQAQLARTEAAYQELATGGRASLAELVQAERVLLEAQIAVDKEMGRVIPNETLDRVTSLKLQYAGLTGSVKEFTAAQEKLITVEQQEARAAAETAAAWQKESEASIASAKAALKAYAEKAVAANKAEAAAKKAQDSQKGALGNFGTIAMGIAEYQAIMMVADGLQESFKAAMDFDKAFTELSTLINTKTPEGAMQVQLLKQQLLELPPELGSITELTKAMYEALSAGIHPGEAVEFIRKTATLAKAALMDQFTAVRLVTTAMDAYGIQTKDADKVTAALMATIQNGKLRGPELADSIGRVLPVAAALKVGLNELLGASDALTMGGVSAEISMTELRQVLATIEKPSKESQKAIAELGTSFAEVRQEIKDRGLMQTLSDLGEKLNGNTELTARMFGNVRALGGVFSLTGEQAQAYKRIVDDITKAYNEGTRAQEAMDKITASQSGQWETFGNILKNKFLVVWNQLTPITNEIGSGFKSLTIDSGLLQIAAGVLITVFYSLGLVLASAGAVIEGVRSGLYGIAYAAGQAMFFTHAYTGSAENMTTKLESLKKGMDEANESSKSHINSLGGMEKAYRASLGIGDQANKQLEEFGKQQKLAAKAADDLTIAQQELTKQRAEANEKAQEEKTRLESVAAAAKKAEKATREYADAHKIPLAAELQEAVTKARAFYDLMVSTKAPVESQNLALFNYMKTVSALNSVIGDKRTIGQFLFDIGKGSETAKKQLVALEPELLKTVMVTNPVVDAWNDLLEAEQRLGIEGSNTLAKHASDAAEAAKRIRGAVDMGVASWHEYQLAEEEVERANKALAISLGIDVRTAMEKVLDAEEHMGVQGSAVIQKHYQELKASYDSLVRLAASNPAMVSMLDLKDAELKVKLADAEMKAQLGKPIGGEAYSSLVRLNAELKTLHDQMQRNFQIDTQWEQFWKTKAPNTAQAMHNVAEIGKDSFNQFAASFGNVVQEVESGQKSMGAAIKEAVAQTLESISAQAAVQALMQTAEGFASLAIGDFAGAGNHFTAAAEYAAVAVVAGVAGAAMDSGSNANNSNAGVGGTSTGTTSPIQTTVQPVQVQNVQRFAAGGLVSQPTLAIIGDSKGTTLRKGREGILPLDDPSAMSQIGTAVASAMAGSGGDTYNMPITIEGLLSTDSLDKTMELINTRVQAGKKLNATSANRVTRKS